MNYGKFAITILFGVTSALGPVSTAVAEPGVTNVVIRQRWPWSQVVDIDFIVTGTDPTFVRFFAQYDGQARFELAEKDFSGDDLTGELEPGPHHVAWDPVSAGHGDANRTGFSVTAEADSHRTYLVLNLSDGSYRYVDAPPSGGWLAYPENYKTNMVFRRIPAGTKQLGLSNDLRTKLGITAAYTKPRQVTISSDFYLAVYPATIAQTHFVTNRFAGKSVNVSGSTYTPSYARVAYNALRGSYDDGIDWPTTMYSVKNDSVVAAYRDIVSSTFPSEWTIDLPTVCQAEYACRATTPTDQLWSVGGKADDTFETFTNCVNEIALWFVNYTNYDRYIGQRAPNGWGLYDMIGLYGEWNLDWLVSSDTAYAGTDPVGPTTKPSDNARSRRSVAYNTSGSFEYFTTTYLNKKTPDIVNAYRLCIHLKRIQR